MKKEKKFKGKEFFYIKKSNNSNIIISELR